MQREKQMEKQRVMCIKCSKERKRREINQKGHSAKECACLCGTGALTWLQQEKARQASEASAWGGEQTKKKNEEGGRKIGGDTNTKGVEFDTIVCWRETKKPNPQARLFNLHPVTASRFAFNAQHDRRGMVVGRERVSGKSGNAQSDVRAVQSKNERREIKQKGQSARECVIVWHGCTPMVATGEGEAS